MLKKHLVATALMISASVFAGCGDTTLTGGSTSTTTTSSTGPTTTTTTTTSSTTTSTIAADINGTTFDQCQTCHVTPPTSNHLAIKTKYLCSGCHNSLTAVGGLVAGNTPGAGSTHVVAAHAIQHTATFISSGHFTAANTDINSCAIASCHGPDLKLNGCNTCHTVTVSGITGN